MLKRPDLDLASVQSEVAHFRSAKPELHLAFFKAEEVNGKACATPEQARRDIGAFIEDVYNTQRLHSALGYQGCSMLSTESPMQQF